MKKSLVALLVLAGMLAGAQASFADALVVDFNACYSNPLVAMFLTTTHDKDSNGIPDSVEFQVLAYTLAHPTAPGHDIVHAAYLHNLELLTVTPLSGFPNPLPSVAPIPAYAQGQVPSWAMIANITVDNLLHSTQVGGSEIAKLCAAYVTIGDPLKAERMKKVIDDTGLKTYLAGGYSALGNTTFATTYPAFVTATLAAEDTSGLPYLGTDGDADGDGYSNATEWNASTGADDAAKAADFVTRATRNDPPPSLSVSVAKTPAGAIASGTHVTLTATATNGTSPYSYAWKKNGVAVGVTTAAYTFDALAGSNSYTCEVMDSVSPQAVASAPVVVYALDSATLPVMGVAGIALLAGLAGALGVRKIRK